MSLRQSTLRLFAFVVLAAAIAGPWPADGKTIAEACTTECAAENYKRARALLDAGDASGAFRLLLTAALAGHIRASVELGDMYASGRTVDRDDATALEWYLRADTGGDTSRSEQIGNLYAQGVGVAKDRERAVAYWQKALLEYYRRPLGDASAAYSIGSMYREGKGVPRDLSEARRWLESSAAAGNASARNALGDMYLYGEGVGRDGRTALDWYLLGEAAGSSARVEQIAGLYESNPAVKDAALAAQYWRRAAAYRMSRAASDPGSAYALGWMYRDGKGVPQDAAKSRRWFERAAASGNNSAMVAVGDFYFDGTGVARDGRKALDWYLKAEAAGSRDRLDRIAGLYESDPAVEDAAQAADYWRRAAKYRLSRAASDPGSAYALGWMFRDGKGVPRDAVESRRWFEQAAAAGYSSAMVGVGDFYFDGTGVAQDSGKALDWYLKAEAAGSRDRLDRIATLYESDPAVEDAAQAAEYWRRAADYRMSRAATDPGSAYALGWMYRDGKGVPQDAAESRRWFEQAAVAGYSSAMVAVGDSYFDGAGVAQDSRKALDWYLKAEAAGSSDRLDRIATLYESDPAVQDAALGAEYWRRAAAYRLSRAASDPSSAYALGWMYRDGKGVPQNADEARRWLAIAAGAGHKDAAKALAELGGT